MDIKGAFSGFSVNDLKSAQNFYQETLGLKTELGPMDLKIQLPGGAQVFVYQKENHSPASFTILNFAVPNIDAAIIDLTKKGIEFERYNDHDLPQDNKGVFRGLSANMGPDIAWFKDPAGNILSVLQEK